MKLVCNLLLFFLVMNDLPDPRDPKARIFPYSLLLFCILLTELRPMASQRHRARWLRGNWGWIVSTWQEVSQDDSKPEKAPSQSTLSRLLKRLDLWALMQQYHAARRATLPDAPVASGSNAVAMSRRHYALDGKSREGVQSPVTGRTEVDLSILDVEKREVLASRTLRDKQGEATAARSLLKSMGRELPRGVFTGDAAFVSPKLTAAMVSAGHDYILGFKGNAGDVYGICCGLEWETASVICETFDTGHGRQETRRLKRICLSRSRAKAFSKYRYCVYIFCVETECLSDGKIATETRYFLGSRGLKGLGAEEIMAFIRAHWIIESGLHWVKDVVLGEDDAPSMSNRSSRVLGFFKNIVVSVGYSIFRSVRRFLDAFDSEPMKWTRRLFQLE